MSEGTTKEDPLELTFEEAYQRLKDICDELRGELPLARTLALLREGHGVERGLRTHLEGLEKQLEEIEAGSGLVEVRIVPERPQA